MAKHYSDKINELENLRDRRKLLRKIQLSKQRLLYENPQAIMPFIKDKIRQTLDHSYSETDEEYIPIQVVVSRHSTPVKNHSRNNRDNIHDYLDVIKQQKQLIEKELQLVRKDESHKRKQMDKRIKQIIKSKQDKTDKVLNDLRSNLHKMTILQKTTTRSNYSDILQELQNLRSQYISDGGRDISLIRDMDDLINLASMNQNIPQRHSYPNNNQFPTENPREKELNIIEQQIKELEKELDLRQLKRDPSQQSMVKSEHGNSINYNQLHEEMYNIQKELKQLKQQNKQPFDYRNRFSPSPSLNVDLHLKQFEESNVILLIDFVTGVSRQIKQARLTLTVYHGQDVICSPVDSVDALIKPKRDDDLNASFVVHLRQPVLKCPVSQDVFALIQLKTIKESGVDYEIDAWTKFPLFLDTEQLNIGRWCQPLYINPVEPFMLQTQLYKLAQYHRSVVHYRITTPHDNVEEEVVNDNLTVNNYQPQNYYYRNINPFVINNFHNNFNDKSDDEKSDITTDLSDNAEFGLQIIRIKHLSVAKNDSDLGLMVKVRLTVYHTSRRDGGQIMMSHDGPVTCCSSSVRDDFKSACYQFGRQMARFYGLEDLSADCLIIARVYVEEDPEIIERKNNTDNTSRKSERIKEREEFLVGWTALPLVNHRSIARKNPSYFTDNLKLLKINKGSHDLNLYEPPVLPPSMIFFDRKQNVVGQNPYGRAKIKLRLFHTKPAYDSATSSDNESDIEDYNSDTDQLPKDHKLWVPIDRKEPEITPHNYEDGIDLYLDCARFLPDSATAVKIDGRIVNRQIEDQGPRFSAITKLTSDIYNPVFQEKIEIRDPNLSPSATLLLKFLTFDRETKELVVMGYSAINLFTETGTGNQPEFDNLGVLISLNDGGHQLRIYQSGPNDGKNSFSKSYPFSSTWFDKNKIQSLPGSTMLIRMYKPPKNNDGRTINKTDVPINHWSRLGVFVPAPKYQDGYYYSMSCRPLAGELQILRSFARRPPVILNDLAVTRWADFWRKIAPIAELYKIFEGFPAHVFDVNHVVHYDPLAGFKISVDGAVNIPWNGMTLAHIVLYPPGALYMDKPYLAYDRPHFISKIDLKSTISAPIWTNEWKTYRRRKYNEHLIAILHLHEMNISVIKSDFKFTLESEAWIPIQIFSGPYCNTKSVQMPLILGSPQFSDFEKLQHMSVREFLEENRTTNKLDILPQTSVIVRQCDSRRINEVSISADDELLVLDQSYLPEGKLKNYTKIYNSNKDANILSLMPLGFTQDVFADLISVKFRSLVYKYYDQQGFKRL